MAAPEGYNALGKIGISYKGDYDSNTTYERLDAVEHNGSTYLAIKDAPDGAPRDDKLNWIYLAKGFSGDIGDSEIAFTEAENRENINTGESVKTVFGKIKKFFTDLTAPAFAQMITSKDDLLATKATGYVPDAKAVADAVSEVNGKLALSDGGSKLGVANGVLTYSQLRKYGKIVNISFRLTDCSIPYGVVIGTLPEGYRPSTMISILGAVFDGSTSHTGTISLFPNGNIFQEITRTTIRVCIFSGSFIID